MPCAETKRAELSTLRSLAAWRPEVPARCQRDRRGLSGW